MIIELGENLTKTIDLVVIVIAMVLIYRRIF